LNEVRGGDRELTEDREIPRASRDGGVLTLSQPRGWLLRSMRCSYKDIFFLSGVEEERYTTNTTT
jgi:hypothetical protein